MSESVSASTAPQPSKPPVLRLIGVFLSPGETFADIARMPDFVFPLIVLVLSSAATIETMLWKIGTERIVRNSLEMSGQAAKMSPDQLEQVIHRGAGFTAIIMHVSAFLGAPIYLLVVTGIGLLILNPLLGAQVGFKPVFSVTSYAALVRTVGSIMAIPLIFIGDPEHFNPQNPVPTNLGFFLDPQDVPKALYSLANSFDLLSLWFLIVLSLGLSQLTGGKIRPRSIFLTFFGLWMILILGRAGWAALF